MKPILVLYATGEGHTQHVAEHVAETLIAHELDAKLLAVKDTRHVELAEYAGAVLLSSIHAGRHARRMIVFAREHRAQLEKMPTAFISVSMTEAMVEAKDTSDADRAKALADRQRYLDELFAATGWKPAHVLPVAGALLFEEVGFFKRLILKAIVRARDPKGDTMHNQVFTDWAALDGFVAGLVPELRAG